MTPKECFNGLNLTINALSDGLHSKLALTRDTSVHCRYRVVRFGIMNRFDK